MVSSFFHPLHSKANLKEKSRQALAPMNALASISLPNLPHRQHQAPSKLFPFPSPPLRLPLLLRSTPTRFASCSRRIVAGMASNATDSSQTKPFSVLFVCLGNICRSPAAEGVFRSMVRDKGLQSRFSIDSSGTIGYHEGNPADSRMRAAAKRRGIEITSISRPIRPSDFTEFDLILAMDKQNRADILQAFDKWEGKASLPSDAYKKVSLMCSYCKKHKETEVPDPYYGGHQGFEHVLDILEDACGSLLDSILEDNHHT